MSTGFQGHKIYDAVENFKPTDVDRDTIVRGNHLVSGYLGAGKQALIATDSNEAELIFAPKVDEGSRYRMKDIDAGVDTFKIARTAPERDGTAKALVIQQFVDPAGDGSVQATEVAAFDATMVDIRAPMKVHGELTVVTESGSSEQAVFEEQLVIESSSNLEMKQSAKILFHDSDNDGSDFAIDVDNGALRIYDVDDESPMVAVETTKVVIAGDLEVDGKLTTVDGTEAKFQEKAFFQHSGLQSVTVDQLNSSALYSTSDLYENFKAAKDAYEAADSILSTAVKNEASTARGEELALSGAISNEASTARGEEGALSTAVKNEQTARESADSTLSTAVKNEASTARGEELALSGAISNEASTARGEEGALSTAVKNEQTARESADSTLSTAVKNEASTARGEELALSGAISNEASTARGEELALSTAIVGEATARANADVVINATISTLEGVVTLQLSTLSGLHDEDAQALDDLHTKDQVFTLDGANSDFYLKDGFQPTIVGKMYIDENGFVRVRMPDNLSTLNGLFDERIYTASTAGNVTDIELGYEIPADNSAESVRAYYGF